MAAVRSRLLLLLLLSCFSRVRLCVTPQTAAHQAPLSLGFSRQEHWSGLPFPPAFHLSQHQGFFSNELALPIRWPKYWSFSFSISPSSEYSVLISFRMDWLDLLAVQGTFKSLLQHHSSKSSILWHSTFFTVQLSQPYMTTRKTLALTLQAFVSKMMSLLFNMLSRFVIAFLPRSKHLLILWLQSSDFWSPRKQSVSLFPIFSHLFAMKRWIKIL